MDRGALYCDYCNAYNRKGRSWNLVAIGMQILGLAGVLNSNCSIKLSDFCLELVEYLMYLKSVPCGPGLLV